MMSKSSSSSSSSSIASLSSACLLICIATICCIQYAEAIRCYVCNSHDDPLCFSAPTQNATFQVECPGNATVCRKQRQWIDGDHGAGLGPDDRIIRSCGYNATFDKQSKPCIHQAGLDTQQDQCYCIVDLCNSAPNHREHHLRTAVLPLLFVSGVALLMRQ